jgi:hypothetical protein
MANSAADGRGAELEIRKKLTQSGAVDVMVSVGLNFFYTVTLPCTLWFFDRSKARGPREDQILFVRGEEIELDHGSERLLREHFGKSFRKYADVPGLCKVASVKDVEARAGASTLAATSACVSKRTTRCRGRSRPNTLRLQSGGLAKIALEENEPMAYGITYVCKLP